MQKWFARFAFDSEERLKRISTERFVKIIHVAKEGIKVVRVLFSTLNVSAHPVSNKSLVVAFSMMIAPSHFSKE